MPLTFCSSAAADQNSSSTSSIIADTVTGSHVLKIECYSATKDYGIANIIKSSTFEIGGHSWYVSYCPNGDGTKYSTSCVSLFLCLDPLDGKFHGEVRARSKFSLLDPLTGTPDRGYTSNCQNIRTYTASDPRGWGYSKFIKAKDLDDPRFLKDDCFSIKIDVSVVNIVSTKASGHRQFVAVPPSDLHQDLGWLLISDQGSDITFEVSGELFAAHRYVLAARSSVFRAELLGPMKEKERVLISDMEVSVFKTLLTFIYTDSLPDMGGQGEKSDGPTSAYRGRSVRFEEAQVNL
ncbi:hypothetical protein QOZ80_9AG0689710 [Eleusine coracana subsp. coracana]|nr:hypothetical protein QOZ80_9AG0689710 [Eleusine coracana subsp. coracana]